MKHHIIYSFDCFRGEQSQVSYLTPGSPAHQGLVTQLQKPQFLQSLKLTAHGQHTGQLEVLHSLLLSYVSKRVNFNPEAYEGRVKLAIIDHNANCGREILRGEYC